MQIGGNDFNNSHSESCKLPVLVKSSLEKTAKTCRKEFDIISSVSYHSFDPSRGVKLLTNHRLYRL